jgi:hypothetical protein
MPLPDKSGKGLDAGGMGEEEEVEETVCEKGGEILFQIHGLV